MQLHPSHEILSSFPYGALPAPEAWRSCNRPAGWAAFSAAETLFGDWDEMFLEGEVFLSPELEAAYDRAIDAAFARVADLFCGPVPQAS
jgi:hypothetical protein